jgi:hypothetical protein
VGAGPCQVGASWSRVPSAASSAGTLGKRAAGCFSSARRITLSQTRGDVGAELARRGDGAPGSGPGRRRSGVAAERRAPGERVVEHRAERVDVGAGVDRPARTCSGAMYSGVPTIMLVAVMPACEVRAGDAEVDQLDALLRVDEDVGGLEVAVDDADAWAAVRPSHSWAAIGRSWAGDSVPRRLMRAPRLSPDTYSIDRNTRPCSSPTSCRRTTLGWEILRARLASRRSRSDASSGRAPRTRRSP